MERNVKMDKVLGLKTLLQNQTNKWRKDKEKFKDNKKENNMEKPFKKLRGNRVYLLIPKIDEGIIVLPEEVKKVLMEKEVEKLDKMEVYAVGELVLPEDIKEGDIVLVDRVEIARASVIKLTDKLSVLCISSVGVMHVWN